jgi:molybdopterin-guanine dinucleotide biosynthesis protein A
LLNMVVLGICVGGRGLRMGGVQKALLIAPDTGETLVARLVRLGREAGCEVVLLGAAELGAAAAGVPQLPDAGPELGPLAGLASLLRHAGERSALCLACDMPYVSAALLARLAHATLPTDADVLAPRDPASGKWEPLCARYESRVVAPVLERALAEGERSFQALFKRLTVRELSVDAQERMQLRDWDTPEDMRAIT